jgi:hypothetical protein
MTSHPGNPQQFYASPGPVTDPGDFAPLLEGLPRSVESLVELVQGLIVHVVWAERYGFVLPESRKGEVNVRPLSAKLRRILELDPRPLQESRPVERRLVGTCRDFSLLLCAIQRLQGIPSRARCGFATYFLPDHYEDHWICEWWDAAERRWVRTDAQLDEFQRRKLEIPFDPLDMPEEPFWAGGKAWQKCRTGELDPNRFGIFDYRGLWFVQGNLVRDFLSLNKLELLPWDPWGLVRGPEDPLLEPDRDLLDTMAALTLERDVSFEGIASLFAREPRLRPAAGWVA